MKLQKRNGTCWLQVDRRVTVDAQTSLDALAAFSLAQMAPIQGRWSRHVVGRRGRAVSRRCGGRQSIEEAQSH